MVTVHQIETTAKKQVSRFINLPFALYANRPQWVPLLSLEARSYLDRQKFPFYDHSQADFFIASRNGRDIGRLAVLEHRPFNAYHGTRQAQFYFFECLPDREAAMALFDCACTWASGNSSRLRKKIMKSNLTCPTTAQTLVALLRRRAERQPHRRAYTFLANGETEAACLTYAALDRRARIIGAWLQQLEAEGRRVLLLYPPGLEFLTAFFGCLYAGAVAVPAAYSLHIQHARRRLQTIAQDAQATIGLTEARLLAKFNRILDGSQK